MSGILNIALTFKQITFHRPISTSFEGPSLVSHDSKGYYRADVEKVDALDLLLPQWPELSLPGRRWDSRRVPEMATGKGDGVERTGE